MSLKRNEDGSEERACPFCGLTIITDKRQNKISHEVPECVGFVALMRTSKKGRIVFQEDRDPVTGNLRPRSKV